MVYRQMNIDDYDGIIGFWRATRGIAVTEADSRDNMAAFLERNGQACFVAEDGNRIVGTCLAGNDGRRGYLYHLAVREEARLAGIGSALVERCLAGLRGYGIEKVHLFVMGDNADAIEWYRRKGWKERTDLAVFSKSL